MHLFAVCVSELWIDDRLSLNSVKWIFDKFDVNVEIDVDTEWISWLKHISSLCWVMAAYRISNASQQVSDSGKAVILERILSLSIFPHFFHLIESSTAPLWCNGKSSLCSWWRRLVAKALRTIWIDCKRLLQFSLIFTLN